LPQFVSPVESLRPRRWPGSQSLGGLVDNIERRV